MSRRTRVLAAVGVVVALLVGAAWSALLGWTTVVSVGENVYVLHTGGLLGTIGANVVAVTQAGGTLVVDAQLPPLAARIQRKLDGLRGGPIRFLVNTHWHPDHTGGNEILRVEGEIVAHTSVRTRRAETQEGFNLTGPGSHHVFSPLPDPALPTRFIEPPTTLTVGDLAVEVRHLQSAHTDGDLRRGRPPAAAGRVARGRPGRGTAAGIRSVEHSSGSWRVDSHGLRQMIEPTCHSSACCVYSPTSTRKSANAGSPRRRSYTGFTAAY